MKPTKCPHCGKNTVTFLYLNPEQTRWHYRCRNCNLNYSDRQRNNPISEILARPEPTTEIVIWEDEFVVQFPAVNTNWGDDNIVDATLPELEIYQNNEHVEIPRPEENGPLDNGVSEVGY